MIEKKAWLITGAGRGPGVDSLHTAGRAAVLGAAGLLVVLVWLDLAMLAAAWARFEGPTPVTLLLLAGAVLLGPVCLAVLARIDRTHL